MKFFRYIGAFSPNAVAVGLTFVLGVWATYTAWDYVRQDAEAEVRARFEFRVSQLTDAIRGRMADQEDLLRGAAALFAASNNVERDAWRAYVSSLELQKRFPGVLAMGFALRVRAADKAAHERRLRSDGFPQYAIFPAGERPEHVPVIYVEPYSGPNSRVMGFDIFSEPERRAAIALARDTGRVTITGKITLMQDALGDPGTHGRPAGLLMLAPIYRKGASTNLPDERRQAVIGYAYSALRVPDLMREIPFDHAGIRVELFEGATPSPGELMYDSAAATTPGAIFTGSRYWRTEQLNMHGRTWTLSASSLPAFDGTRGFDRERLVLASGIALALALTAITWLLSNLRARALALAQAMTSQLRASEVRSRMLASLVEQSSDAMFSHDLDGVVKSWNEAAASLFGFSSEEALGRSVRQLHLAGVGDAEWEQVRESFASRIPETYEAQRRNRAGAALDLLIATSPQYDEEGNHVGKIVSMRDITRRKQVEDELRESRQQLTLALQGSNLALFDWDIPTGQVRLSELWNVLLGGAPQPTVALIGELEKLVHPEDLPVLHRRIQNALKGVSPSYQVEHRVRIYGGGWKWISSTAKVVERDAAGRALRVTGTNADISARKEIENLKNDFIATVNHELRTPLTSVIGALDLLKMEAAGKLDGEAAMFLGMAQKNSERLAVLVNDILDIEKLESGLMELQREPVALAPFLERAIALNSPYAQQFAVKLRLVPAPTVTVLADEQRLMQVVTNLLSNAIKYSPRGDAVTVQSVVRERECRISVQDCGPGVPEEFRGRIFGKFAQADSTNTRMKGGTGLGLAISKALVEKMGGRIGFESVCGEGATFYVDLPMTG